MDLMRFLPNILPKYAQEKVCAGFCYRLFLIRMVLKYSFNMHTVVLQKFYNNCSSNLKFYFKLQYFNHELKYLNFILTVFIAKS